MESIFYKLLKARRNSDEDYLTELLALTLGQVNGLTNKYIQFLCQKGNISFNGMKAILDNPIETQKYVTGGIIDLIIKTDKVNDTVFICEHKWWNGKLQNNQIASYMNCVAELGFKKAYSVLITPSTAQWTQQADIRLRWSDVYEFLISIINDYQNNERFIIEQFAFFLENNGMNKYDKIKPEAIYNYFDVINLKNYLKEIFDELQSNEWLRMCPSLKVLEQWSGHVRGSESKIHPALIKERWGRLGIDFLDDNSWSPNLFAGVILNTWDHRIEPEDRDKGPDFVVLLDVNYNDGYIYNSVLSSKEYADLLSRLDSNSGSFMFIPHNKLMNKWRLAVLKKPLADILIGKYEYDEQKKAIEDAIIDGINLMFK